jgi:hypothetical protein
VGPSPSTTSATVYCRLVASQSNIPEPSLMWRLWWSPSRVERWSRETVTTRSPGLASHRSQTVASILPQPRPLSFQFTMSWDSKSVRRRGNSTVAQQQKDQPLPIRQSSSIDPIQSRSLHVSDPFLQSFLPPSFDPAAYLNASLPHLQPGSYSSSLRSSTATSGAVSLADLSTQAQTLLSQLNAHTARLSNTLTVLTDDILRSGSRLAYEVELLRGETLSLSEAVNETLHDDIKRFVPEGLDNSGDVTRNPPGLTSQDERGPPALGAATQDPAEPPYITQLRTLTLVRTRLDSVIKTFGDAMEFIFPPSELSVSSSFLSVSAPEPGAEAHSTEEKGQQVLQSLRDEIASLLSGAEDPIRGIELAAQRIERLKELTVVWKGTSEEKGRTKFIESLAKMVEDRHRELLRELEIASRKEGKTTESGGMRPRNGSFTAEEPVAESRAYSAGYGIISQLQKIRSGL